MSAPALPVSTPHQDSPLSTLRLPAGGHIPKLQPSCSSNDEVALVWAPYPPEGWVRLDFVFTTSDAVPADVSGTADSPASTATLLVDTTHPGSWDLDAFVGAELLVVAGPGAGQRRSISGNDATSITLDSPFPAPLGGAEYAVVAPAGSKQDHINLAGGDAGTFILIGFHIERPYLDNVLTASEKDPSNRFAVWRLRLENDFDQVSPNGSLIHLNAPTTDYFFQMDVRDAHRSVLDTSGNVLMVGSSLHTAPPPRRLRRIPGPEHRPVRPDHRLAALQPRSGHPDAVSRLEAGRGTAAGSARRLDRAVDPRRRDRLRLQLAARRGSQQQPAADAVRLPRRQQRGSIGRSRQR